MNIIDKTILAPYYLVLKFRHFLFDKNIKKTYKSSIKTISVGNVTVGGTGKTPHTEMILRLLGETMPKEKLAVLSRGYKRKSRGFQQVSLEGSAKMFGDEPFQIKNKFPKTTVVVDSSRKRALQYLENPKTLLESKKVKKCRFPELNPVDVVVLDDAFQHRAVTPNVSIVLMDYSKPIYEDHLLPIGRLRDLPSRVKVADILIFTKCSVYMEDLEKCELAKSVGVKNYDCTTGLGQNESGANQWVFFTSINYINSVGIFDNADTRYIYSKRLILFTGIANDAPLVSYLCDNYDIVEHFNFPDHHSYSKSNMNMIFSSSKLYPTAVIMTTEKDAQKIKDYKEKLPLEYQKKMFQVPIEVDFLEPERDKINFINAINSLFLSR